jgi:hypoxanthine phosphoribosyltransferase
MADVKRPWSYEQVHEIVRQAVEEAAFWDDWRPTLIVCIAAGG